MSDLKKLIIYSDGGARGNPGPAAIGVLVCDEKDEPLQEYQQTIGEATNNVAEYRAVIKGLELAQALGGGEVQYFVDSELVANQLLGVYRIKTPHIRELFMQVVERIRHFKKVNFIHVPRTHPKISYVDKLVNQVLNREGY
ncbi:MAG: ribonuclease HI family protein [Candidatus Omnitrophica bacterium]|nr:ribonuclease HI family protein [Candidatus Omnitrophota bacterium]MDD5670019.1 ribonuclease HI family protein [Candidatus Omnitrophota bacterium]